MRKSLGTAAALCLLGFGVWNCGSDGGGANGSVDGGFDDAQQFQFGDDGGDGASGPCVNLQCQQVACEAGKTTSLSGKVFAPEGTIPLYNVIVYVPNAPVEAFKPGLTCDQCGQISGSPVVSTLTNEKGEFVLKNVPVGTDIPVVFQVGKWRRQIKIPSVTACIDTRLAAANTRLPRNSGEGDLPQMAITTGSADSLECFLRRVGISDSEFTNPTGTGKVHVYHGNGSQISGGSPDATTLWNDVNTLKKYDISVLSCEGNEFRNNLATSVKDPYLANIETYLNAGGRVFSSHFHYVWFRYGSATMQSTATWTPTGGTSPFTVDTDFPKGVSFADWLMNVGASTTRGQIALTGIRASVADTKPPSRRWIHSASPLSAKYLSFNAPVGLTADKQCGRGVFSDVHVSGGGSANGVFPTWCSNTPMNTNEKALLFLFFDLASCITDDSKPPVPPPPIPR